MTLSTAAVDVPELLVAAAGHLPLPALQRSDYGRAHALFEARSDQRGVLTTWLTTRTARIRPPGRSLRVLSVGAGDGALDAAVITALLEADPLLDLAWVCIEPIADSALACHRRLQVLARTHPFEGRVEVGRFEDVDLHRVFDVVTFVHSLYYVTDVPSTLQAAAALLAPRGRLLLAHAPRTGLNELAAALAPPVDERPQWWSQTTRTAVRDLALSGDGQRLDGRLDLSSCLDPDDTAGRAVLDFTVQAQLPDELRPHVLAILRRRALAGSVLDVAHPVDVWDLCARGAA